jgi:hypothetical protein
MLAAPPTCADPVPPGLAPAAASFLATLDPARKAKAQLPFDSAERLNWFYIPKDREGLPLGQMTPAQQRAALALIEAGLSQKGFSKAEAVRALDAVLAEIERDPVRRDVGKYYLTIFGEPSDTGTWGMRWEGHHISLHWTLVGGRASATTPQFFGSNPAEVRDGPKKGTRVLGAEQDLGRALLLALTDAQRAVAIVSATAPADILTANTRKAAIQDNTGLPYAEMTPPVAAARVAALKAAGLDEVKFAWMGGAEKGAPHYYRVQGPTFLIEYDCVQDGANHIHAVWRDLEGDFGMDLLEAHYRRAPHHQRAHHRHRR